MLNSISPNDLQKLFHKADVTAHRLRRRLQLPWGDLDDLRQDLLTDILGRLRAYDQQRGSLGAFAATVMANRASVIACRVSRRQRLFGRVPVSLDDPIPGHGEETLGELLSEEMSLAATQGHWVDPVLQVERRIDIERALARLDEKGRRLLAELLMGSAHWLARAGRGSRSALYRQKHDLRLVLMAAGIAAA